MPQVMTKNKQHPRLQITVAKYLNLTNLIEYYNNRKYESTLLYKQ